MKRLWQQPGYSSDEFDEVQGQAVALLGQKGVRSFTAPAPATAPATATATVPATVPASASRTHTGFLRNHLPCFALASRTRTLEIQRNNPDHLRLASLTRTQAHTRTCSVRKHCEGCKGAHAHAQADMPAPKTITAACFAHAHAHAHAYAYAYVPDGTPSRPDASTRHQSQKTIAPKKAS